MSGFGEVAVQVTRQRAEQEVWMSCLKIDTTLALALLDVSDALELEASRRGSRVLSGRE
jgi:hypothetical protein